MDTPVDAPQRRRIVAILVATLVVLGAVGIDLATGYASAASGRGNRVGRVPTTPLLGVLIVRTARWNSGRGRAYSP